MAQDRVQAVERALSILDSFHEGQDRLTLMELADRTGLHKSTILRLCSSLERKGYLMRLADGCFRLGPSVWRLGSLYRSSFDLGEHIRPELRRLVSATGETASFYIREGNERVCLYRINSPKPIRHHLDEGARLPLDAGATAHVLIAFSEEAGKFYERIRKDGHYTSIGERDPDIAAVAVPVFDQSHRLRGALSISGLVGRLDEAARMKALTMIRESTARLESVLGA